MEYKRLPDTAKTSMSLVAAADYLVYEKQSCRILPERIVELQEKVQQFYEGQKAVRITKQTKKREIEMDLKPLIYEMKALNLKDVQTLHDLKVKNPEILTLSEDSQRDPYPALFLKISTGSADNVKPELILEAFCRFHHLPYEDLNLQVHRLEVYANADEVPVKGERERNSYQAYLNKQKKQYRQKGMAFPQFFTLGELGKDID